MIGDIVVANSPVPEKRRVITNTIVDFDVIIIAGEGSQLNSSECEFNRIRIIGWNIQIEPNYIIILFFYQKTGSLN